MNTRMCHISYFEERYLQLIELFVDSQNIILFAYLAI